MKVAEQFDSIQAALRGPGEPPYSAISLLGTQALLQAATGELDLNIVARAFLAGQGIGAKGEWVGFAEAAEYWRGLSAPGDIAAARRAGSAKSERKSEQARINGRKRKKSVPTLGQEGEP